MQRKELSFEAQEKRLGWYLLSPTALIVFGLVVFPVIFTLWASTHQIRLSNLNQVFSAPFTGWTNFMRVIDDSEFLSSALITIINAVFSTILSIILGITAAVILNTPFFLRGLARSIFLFPYVAPVVSTALVWRWLLDPKSNGVLNDLLLRLSLIEEPLAYLATRGLAIILVIAYQAWRYFPFCMLMFLARLQAVDKNLYEAAEVDGATWWQRFYHITLSQLGPVIHGVFVLRLIWTFNKFDDIYLLTSGGFGTKVLPILTYQFSFGTYDFGKGAASSLILLFILLLSLALYSALFLPMKLKERNLSRQSSSYAMEENI